MPELAAGMTPAAARDVATGVALLAAGAVTWARARHSRTGPLLVLTGAAWLGGGIASALVYAHRGPLVHTLLTYPNGRTHSAPIVAVIALAYLDGLVPAVARSPWVTIALMASTIGAAGWRWAAAHGPERRARLVALACAVAVAAPLMLAALGRLAGMETDVVATWAYQAAIAVTAGALAVDLLSGRSVRAAATGLVVDLAGSHEPGALKVALARTVGDPALEIAYRVNDEWVDETGELVHLPAERESGECIVTVVEDGATPVAALAHDPAALRDETLARSVAAAVRLALANVRLQTDIAERVREVEASRRRLVEAGDEQRRHLREQLRGGAEQALADVSHGLVAAVAGREGETATALVELVDELDAARTDLARFAQGVHPKALTEHGLSVALDELAGQAVVPVAVDVPLRRFAAPQEAAVFFLCSEALANVAKYADASSVSIDVAEAGSRLVVCVADDGRGGADPVRGSGLRGLADRVEALGGTLSVTSTLGAGTRLEAELPIGLAVS
jgi:signal transduction histidine kinase